MCDAYEAYLANFNCLVAAGTIQIVATSRYRGILQFELPKL